MNLELLRQRATKLHLNGVLAHWSEVETSDWLPKLVEWEEEERTRRSLERRLSDARLGRFKPLADFDWKWPTRCDREAIEGLMSLEFIAETARRLRHYAAPDVLVIDEIGYLSYSNRHADLLFELVSRRYETKSTIVTTNKAFSEWSEVFPNAACVVSLVDRLVHHSEVISIEGESYRLKEAQARAEQRGCKKKKGKS